MSHVSVRRSRSHAPENVQVYLSPKTSTRQKGARSHRVDRAGSPRLEAAGTAPSAQLTYHSRMIDEHEAWDLWKRCNQLVAHFSARELICFTIVKVRGAEAELSVRTGGGGAHSQWWLRLLSGALVITGNRHGLLPMSEGVPHGQ